MIYDELKKLVESKTGTNYPIDNHKQFLFWRENLSQLDFLIKMVGSAAQETDADALKRLGKLDFLLGIKNMVFLIEEIILEQREEQHER